MPGVMQAAVTVFAMAVPTVLSSKSFTLLLGTVPSSLSQPGLWCNAGCCDSVCFGSAVSLQLAGAAAQ